MGCARENVKACATIALALARPALMASTRFADAEPGVARREEVLQRRDGRDIDDAVDLLRAEMALEGSHGVASGAIEITAGGDVIAVARQQRLRLFDGGIGFAERENRSRWVDRSGLHPQADAGIGKRLPGKFFAGIALARGRNVGMGKHALGRNPVAGENAAAERRPRRDLPFRKGGIAMIMAGIGDLDADRARIDVALPAHDDVPACQARRASATNWMI